MYHSWAGGSHRGNKTESCRPVPVLLTRSRLLMRTPVDFSLKCQRHEGETSPWPPWIWINEIFRRWVFSARRPGGSVIILSCEVHRRWFFSLSMQTLNVRGRAGDWCRGGTALWTGGPLDVRASQWSWACVPVLPVLLVLPVLSVPGLPELASLITSLWSLLLTPDCHFSINIHAEFQPEFHLNSPTADCRWTFESPGPSQGSEAGPRTLSWADSEPVSSQRKQTCELLPHVNRTYRLSSSHPCWN